MNQMLYSECDICQIMYGYAHILCILIIMLSMKGEIFGLEENVITILSQAIRVPARLDASLFLLAIT